MSFEPVHRLMKSLGKPRTPTSIYNKFLKRHSSSPKDLKRLQKYLLDLTGISHESVINAEKLS